MLSTEESGDAMKSQRKAVAATGWLVKPFNPQRLLGVVRKALEVRVRR